MRKRFECGHKGLGQACRRCITAAELHTTANSGFMGAEDAQRYKDEARRLWDRQLPKGQQKLERERRQEEAANKILSESYERAKKYLRDHVHEKGHRHDLCLICLEAV